MRALTVGTVLSVGYFFIIHISCLLLIVTDYYRCSLSWSAPHVTSKVLLIMANYTWPFGPVISKQLDWTWWSSHLSSQITTFVPSGIVFLWSAIKRLLDDTPVNSEMDPVAQLSTLTAMINETPCIFKHVRHSISRHCHAYILANVRYFDHLWCFYIIFVYIAFL